MYLIDNMKYNVPGGVCRVIFDKDESIRGIVLDMKYSETMDIMYLPTRF